VALLCAFSTGQHASSLLRRPLNVSKKDALFRLTAQLDSHFAAEDVLPAHVEHWREVKRHIARMMGGLTLVEMTLREERERGIPITEEAVQKLESYARFGLGEE
jgi:hypothetical protein